MEAAGYTNPDTHEDADEPIRKSSSLRKSLSTAMNVPPEANLHLSNHEDPDADDDSGNVTPSSILSRETSACIGKGGVVWHAKIMTDDYGDIKPLRPLPCMKFSELCDGLKKVNGRWLYTRPMNGWEGLVNLELRSLTVAEKGLLKTSVTRLWNAGTEDEAADLPDKASIPKRTRATFVAPDWTGKGWSEDSPGYVWWWSRCSGMPHRLLYGEKMIDQVREGAYASASATWVHAFAHRYPIHGAESLKDRQTWHSGVVVEWSHGEFSTLIELAFKDGCGGYGGRTNWREDKNTPTELCSKMPVSMKCPWDCTKTEVRMLDVPFRNRDEFEAYLDKYRVPKPDHRFLEPTVYDSGPVRLRSVSPSHLAGYILNYIARAHAYIEFHPDGASNCQTFAADLYSFLNGKRDSKPYGSVIQAAYRQRSFSFLYAPDRT